MYYALVSNNNIVAGPRMWSWSFFNDYFQQNNLDISQFPRTAPANAVISTTWSLLPVTDPSYPANGVNEPYEQLSGPYWTVYTDHIDGYYTSVPTPLESIKGTLREKAMVSRYNVESIGVTVTVQNTVLTAHSTRDTRDLYLIKSLSIGDSDTINWKFKEQWMTLSKSDLQNIHQTIHTSTQSLYDWEYNVTTQINNANTAADLQAITVLHPKDPFNPQNLRFY